MCQVKGKSNASNSIYLRDIRMRIVCWRAIIVSLVWVVKWAVSTSGSWVGIVVGVSSGKVRALILDDFLKYIVENGFGVIWILHILRDAEDIATLADVVFNVLIITLVCKLSHFYSIVAKKQGVRKVLFSMFTYFSEANCSSKSNKSSDGGGKSLMQGRKTAA